MDIENNRNGFVILNEDGLTLSWRENIEQIKKVFTNWSCDHGDRIYLELMYLAKTNKTFCVIDESITIKNAIASRTKRLLSMWNLFEFRLILNGTPVSKGLIDLYSQINFIHPKILSMTEAQFARNFLVYKIDGYRSWNKWSRPANEAALIEIIRPYIFDSDLDIPVKKYVNSCHFHLSDQEEYEYANHKDKMLEKYFIEDNFYAIAQSFHRKYTLCESKIDKLKKIVQEKEKCLVFVKFLDEVDLIKKTFSDAFVMTGRQKDSIEEFKKNGNILICTYGTGSMGLNLQFCSTIIFFSQTFDFKDKEHALHRVYRTGQKRDVCVYEFWVNNVGLENIIFSSLRKKTNTLNNIKKFIKDNGIKNL